MSAEYARYECLTSEKARRLLELHGPNDLERAPSKSPWRATFEIASEPMFLLLLVCGGIYFFIGQIREALLLLTSAIVAGGLTLFQELKSERAIEKLRELSSPRALVVRDGVESLIAGSEIVPGDLVILREGDRVPADAKILRTDHLEADESLLTGESLPVQKHPSTESSVFAGTLIIAGTAIARVTSTGMKTELGRIGKSLTQIDERRPSFQIEANKFVRVLGFLAVLFCILIVLTYGWRLHHWTNAILAGLATAMSMVPEELPMVLAIFLVLGARRISKHSVLTRKMAALENLGTTTVLCVDKTGTLTQNRMVLQSVWVPNGSILSMEENSDPKISELVEFAALANHGTAVDPMEKAIQRARDGLPSGATRFATGWFREKEYPLSSLFFGISCVWRSGSEAGRRVVATKGAPEAIISLCNLSQAEADSAHAAIDRLSALGKRVLAVSRAEFEGSGLPEDRRDFKHRFLGLIGLEDPIRPEVPDAVRECYQAGIRIVMMTGDHPGTACAIARQIGLRDPERVVTGEGLRQIDSSAMAEVVATTNIFARMRPEQKLGLVKSLQTQGEIATMTGDGVNDAPSLKAADIGIAMEQRGTDVAREAADLVLMDDNFASIVQAIRLGRRIFDNIRDAASYILSIHVPIAGMALVPVLLKMPLVLLPPQIVFLEFLIDPACSFVFEAEPEDPLIMTRPPRSRGESIFSAEVLIRSALQGVIVLAISLAVYLVAMRSSQESSHARSLGFTTLIFGNLALIFVNRSTGKLRTILMQENRFFYYVLSGAALSLFLMLLVPGLRETFAFNHLEISDLGVSLIAGIICLFLAQGTKRIRSLSRKRDARDRTWALSDNIARTASSVWRKALKDQ